MKILLQTIEFIQFIHNVERCISRGPDNSVLFIIGSLLPTNSFFHVIVASHRGIIMRSGAGTEIDDTFVV